MTKITTPNSSASVDAQVAAGVAREAERTLTSAFGDVTPVDKSTIATVDDKSTVAPSTIRPGGRDIPGRSYAELADAADTMEGHTLEKDKSNLVGVPLVITSFTFRDGVLRNKKPSNYVSAECVIADRATIGRLVKLNRLSVTQAELLIPEEALVLNDGSTGICRQAVAYLVSKGLIGVPTHLPEGGEAGESRYDAYRAEWRKPDGTLFEKDDPFRFDVLLRCDRGLRLSEYDNGAGDSTTFYLA